MKDKSQKRILITGCSSGIGYDAATTLKKRGYNVLASCRKQADVDRLLGEGFNCCLLDLADSASIQRCAEQIRVENTAQPLYAIVNNGAFGVPGAVEDLSREALRFQFETNLFGTHELTVALLPLLRESQEGRIVQISSILGGLSMPFRGAYNASKHALEGLSDTLRLELNDTPIQISLIEPGPIATQFRDNAVDNFRRFIDVKQGPFKDYYKAVFSRLESEKSVPFTLPSSAVTEQIIHAIEAKTPKIRYHTTVPTKLFLPLKRLLPDRWFDQLLLRLGDKPAK